VLEFLFREQTIFVESGQPFEPGGGVAAFGPTVLNAGLLTWPQPLDRTCPWFRGDLRSSPGAGSETRAQMSPCGIIRRGGHYAPSLGTNAVARTRG